MFRRRASCLHCLVRFFGQLIPALRIADFLCTYAWNGTKMALKLAAFGSEMAAKQSALALEADLSKSRRVKQKEVKEGHEKAIGDQLLRALKLEGKFLRHGEDDGEPDLIYSLDDKTVGIEIATAFYHNKQAEIESHLALGKLKSGRFGTPLGVPNDQDKLILSRAQWGLNDKCLKSYSGDEVWLCIDLQAPLLEISEAEQLADAITLPPSHKFARIYFGFHAVFDGNGFTVFELHPGQRK